MHTIYTYMHTIYTSYTLFIQSYFQHVRVYLCSQLGQNLPLLPQLLAVAGSQLSTGPGVALIHTEAGELETERKAERRGTALRSGRGRQL